MPDCLLIGHNDFNFRQYVQMVRLMGTTPVYRELKLAFIEPEKHPLRALDVLNQYADRGSDGRELNNVDFLWPVILFLGSYLSRRGFSFDYVNLFHLEKEKLRQKLENQEFRLVAVTTTLCVVAHPIVEVVKFIKKFNPEVEIVVGGPYVDTQAKLLDRNGLEELFKYIGADYFIMSPEGEKALADLLTALKEGTALDGVHNLAHRQDGRFIFTEAENEASSLELEPIEYDLFPAEEIRPFVSLRTSKSCPFSCQFCSFPLRAGAYRYLPVETVEQELNRLNDLGVNTVTFLDDTFNVPKGRFKQLLEMMIRNRYDFRWNCFYRSDHGNGKIIEMMARAGCEGVFLGMESASDEILGYMNKTARKKHYQEAIPQFRQAGISTYASLLLGFPGETDDTVKETIEFIEKTPPDFYRAQLWYANPLTPIWDRREEIELKGQNFSWSHHTMDAETAANWIESIFLESRESVWLPQQGFEQWSTFYLQRHGMSLDQVKNFLRAFNDVLRGELKGIDQEHQKQRFDRLLDRSLVRLNLNGRGVPHGSDGVRAAGVHH